MSFCVSGDLAVDDPGGGIGALQLVIQPAAVSWEHLPLDLGHLALEAVQTGQRSLEQATVGLAQGWVHQLQFLPLQEENNTRRSK